MKSAQIAAIVGDEAQAQSVASVVEFFGIPWRVFPNLSQLASAICSGTLERKEYAVVAPLPAFHQSGIETESVLASRPTLAYATADLAASRTALRSLTRRDDIDIKTPEVRETQAIVTSTMS